ILFCFNPGDAGIGDRIYVYSDNSITDNDWHFYAVTFNSTYVSMYEDGKLSITPEEHDVDLYTSDGFVKIGKSITWDGYVFDGSIDDIAIFNRSLSPNEISQMYMMNLHKYDTDKWMIYINQSWNSSTGLNEGNYSYFASAKDESGNENVTDNRTVTIDTTAPSITNVTYENLTGTLNGTVFRGDNLTINATVVGAEYVWVVIWEGAVGISNILWQGFLNLISGNLWSVSIETNASFPLGLINYTIYANDTAGNVINFTSNITIVENESVSYCRVLDQAGTTYTLINNIIDNSLIDNCINITAQNVTLDCLGYNITSNQSYAGVFSDQFNTTVRNCNISMGTGEGGYGIHFDGSSNYSSVINNTLIGSNFGIWLRYTNNCKVINNTLYNGQGGMFFRYLSGCQIKNNWVNGTNTQGIQLYSTSNNTLTNNSVTYSNRAYNIYQSSNNILINNKAIGNSVYGIGLTRNSHNNIFYDSNFTLNNAYDVYLYMNSNANASNNTFINVTYDLSKEYIEAGSDLIRKWYYQALVNDSSGDLINNVNVTGYNSSWQIEFTDNTNSSGLIDRIEIIDYVNFGGTRSYYSNYTINASINGLNLSSSYNVTLNENNLNHILTFSDDFINSCTTLSSANTEYEMISDVINNTLIDNCINITAQNVTLDCNGYYILSNQNFSGVFSNQFNTTVKNCNISMGDFQGDSDESLGGMGIKIKTTSSDLKCNIINNTLINQGRGMSINANANDPSEECLILNNTVRNTTYGIHSYRISNSTYSGNLIEDSVYGIYVMGGANNTYSNNIVFNTTSDLICEYTCKHNIFKDSNFSLSSNDAIFMGEVAGVYPSNNTFINVTYDISKENVQSGTDLIRKWYYRAYVNDSSGVVVNEANVSAFNSSDNLEFSYLTRQEEISSSESGLVGLWHFNNDSNYGENSTHVYDFSGNGNNGSVVGDAFDSDSGFTTNGQIGTGARMFDGDEDWIDGTSGDLDGLNISTISMWFKRDAIGGQQALFNEYYDPNNYFLFYISNGNNKFYAFTNVGGITKNAANTSTVFNDVTKWYHLVIVINGSSWTTFVDGAYDTSVSNNDTFTDIPDSHRWRIGSYESSGSNSGYYWNGSIDEVAVWNRSLSTNEIQELYEKGKGGRTNITTITEYVNINGTRNYYNLYSINATNVSYRGEVLSYNVSSLLNNLNHVITISSIPTFSFISPTSLNWTYTNYFGVNVSVSDDNFNNVTVYLYNESNGLVNSSSDTNSTYFANFSLSGLLEGLYYINASSIDNSGNFNSSETRTLIFDNTIPNVTMYFAGMPSNDSVGGSSVLFNWTVVDENSTSLNCSPIIGSTILNYYNVSNASLYNSTETLVGGSHVLKVRCYDNALNLHESDELIVYLVAVINFSLPSLNNATYRSGDSVTLFLEETDGTGFLTNATIHIKNESSFINTSIQASESQSNNWSYSYIFPGIEPQYLTAIYNVFNSSVGSSQNVSSDKGMIFLRSLGSTSNPNITKNCPNATYVVNGSSLEIQVINDLDTLILNNSVVVMDPDGLNFTLNENSSLLSSGFIYTKNYTFNVNKTGTYVLSSNVTDYENQSDFESYSFYSVSGFNTYRINSSTIYNMSIRDKCGSQIISEGSDMEIIVPVSSLIELNVSVSYALHNLSILFNDVNITSNISEIISYGTLSSNATNVTTGQKIISLFEINNSNLSYENYTFVYDYGPVAHIVFNESTLKLWKCENLSSCDYNIVESTVDVDLNTITAVLTNMSIFMVTENATGGSDTVVVTNTIGGGGGGTTTVTNVIYKSLNILTPGQISLGLSDEIIVPIKLVNPETDVSLKTILLDSRSNTPDIDAVFDVKKIDELKPGENKTVFLNLKSHSLPGEYDVDIYANVTDPNFREEAKLYVKLVEKIGKKEIVERIVLAQDLFRENPRCLELNDLLAQAEKLIEEGKINESREIVQEAIYKCKDLITGEDEFLGTIVSNEWKNPIIFTLIFVIIAVIIIGLIRRPRLNLFKAKNEKKKINIFGFKNKRKVKVKRRDKDIWK
ncbi:hypothetical protein GOV12_02245, partial [Candidatus Pacearchaeota archaeon]|nr:hypothetical protein [Candidatus Pacearchaeota archaeon]